MVDLELHKATTFTSDKDTLSKSLLQSRLKSYMVSTSLDMPNDLFMWSTGRNSIVAALLIDVANGEFDEVKG
jgi:hypothetical protein